MKIGASKTSNGLKLENYQTLIRVIAREIGDFPVVVLQIDFTDVAS